MLNVSCAQCSMINLNICFYFMCIGILLTCMYVNMCMSGDQRSEEGIVSPGTGSTGSYESVGGCGEVNPGLCKGNKCSLLLGRLSSPSRPFFFFLILERPLYLLLNSQSVSF